MTRNFSSEFFLTKPREFIHLCAARNIHINLRQNINLKLFNAKLSDLLDPSCENGEYSF